MATEPFIDLKEDYNIGEDSIRDPRNGDWFANFAQPHEITPILNV